jgi:hypothetical protein
MVTTSLRKGLLGAVLAATSLVAASAQAAKFDFVSDDSTTQTVDGITLTVTTNPSYGVLGDSEGIGVNSGFADGTLLDSDGTAGGTDEFMRFNFNQQVRIDSITFGYWDNDDIAWLTLGPNGRIVSLDDDSPVAALGALFSEITLAAGVDSEFAVRSIEVSAVPVPAAAWLFGSALVSVLGLRRQRKS